MPITVVLVTDYLGCFVEFHGICAATLASGKAAEYYDEHDCLSCLYACVCLHAYLKNHMSELHQLFYACCP